MAQSSFEERKVDSTGWPELALGLSQDRKFTLARLDFSVETNLGSSLR